jgi:HlyD family secretion protein
MAKNGSSGWLKWLVILILLAAVVGGAIWFFNGRGDDVVQYQTATVARGELTQAVTATGQLAPVLNVTVGSQISGRISKLYADFNSAVSSNQVIAELDPSTYKANVQRAEADLSSTRASLELAQIETRRSSQLFSNNLVSGSDHDTANANLHQVEATMQIKQAALDSAKVDLDRCTIFSPVNGIVISRNVDVGQTVAASMSAPVLFQIANDLTKMQIDANVSEADIGTVEEGHPVNFTVDAFPGRTFTGKVKQIRNSPTTVQNVVTYDCVIEVSNPDLKLRPGMTANASVVTAQRSGVLKIPNAALRFRPPEPSTNKTFVAKVLAKIGIGGSEAKTAVTNTAPAAKANDTNKVEIAANETTTLTGNEPPEELQRRVGEMRARGEDVPEEIRAKLREYYQSGVLQQPNRGGGGGGFRGAGGARGGGARGDGGSGLRGSQPSSRTIYVLAANTPSGEPMPQAVRVKTGISDGAYTEITDGLKEGDIIITGVKLQQTTVATPPAGASPFGGGGFRGGGR